MKEELENCLRNFDLAQALILTDKMHEIDATRKLTVEEERLWERLTINIEKARKNRFFS